MKIEHDWHGTLVGTALGDAWGKDTEFQRYQQIIDKHGPDGPSLPKKAVVTDDTQMTLYLAEAIKDASTGDLPHRICTGFLGWRTDPRNTADRAPGATCLTALSELARRDGGRWELSSVLDSKGCGANMRVAPAAFLPEHLVEPVSIWQAALTHGHPTALVASWLTADVVRAVVRREVAPGETLAWAQQWLAQKAQHVATSPVTMRWMEPLIVRAHETSLSDYLALGVKETALAIRNALRGLGETGDPCEYGGEGWVAEEALATALLSVDRLPNSPLDAIRHAATTNGDSDSIAAIAGAVVGASEKGSDLDALMPRIEGHYLRWIKRLS